MVLWEQLSEIAAAATAAAAGDGFSCASIKRCQGYQRLYAFITTSGKGSGASPRLFAKSWTE